MEKSARNLCLTKAVNGSAWPFAAIFFCFVLPAKNIKKILPKYLTLGYFGIIIGGERWSMVKKGGTTPLLNRLER